MGIIISLLVLSAVVLVHEYGHYVAMRRNGVKVIEFTIGFGPTLWERKLKSGTMFRLKPILLGGYTRPVAEGEGSMENASSWARLKIYLAGPFANALAAFAVLVVLLNAIGGYPVMLGPYVEWAPSALRPTVAALIGSFGLCLATPVLIVVLIVTKGAEMISDVAGPIGIVAMGSQATTADGSPLGMLMGVVWFFYVINVAIGGFNLLPVFPLDGGHAAELLLRKLSGRFAEGASKLFRIAGLAVFLALIVLVFAADIIRLALPYLRQ